MIGILSPLPGHGTLPNALHHSAGRGMRPNMQMRAAEGPRARRGKADARARPCWGVAGAYRSKQRSNLRLGRSVGAKVGLGPAKIDAIFSLEYYFQTQTAA